MVTLPEPTIITGFSTATRQSVRRADAKPNTSTLIPQDNTTCADFIDAHQHIRIARANSAKTHQA
jgi:hypothetical protein